MVADKAEASHVNVMRSDASGINTAGFHNTTEIFLYIYIDDTPI